MFFEKSTRNAVILRPTPGYTVSKMDVDVYVYIQKKKQQQQTVSVETKGV